MTDTRQDIRDTFKIGGEVQFKLRSPDRTGILKARRATGYAAGLMVESAGDLIPIDARSITKVELDDGSFITKIPFDLKVR